MNFDRDPLDIGNLERDRRKSTDRFRITTGFRILKLITLTLF